MSMSASRHLQRAGRTVWLLVELALAAFEYPFQVVFRCDRPKRLARSRWLQRTCRRLLVVFDVTCRIYGPLPKTGLLVSNHLSYLDVLVLGAATPCVFVAKQEVRTWLVLGWLARLAGTLFVQRDRRSDVVRANGEITKALDDGALVVLFPEGTSSDGKTVLQFKSSLFAPVSDRPEPIFAGAIAYKLADGNASQEVCYWGDMTLVPHLLNLLGKKAVSAHVAFSVNNRSSAAGMNRKELAQHLHGQVRQLSAAVSFPPGGRSSTVPPGAQRGTIVCCPGFSRSGLENG